MNELYQPDTLNSLRNAWQRVISDKGLKMNIKIDSEYDRSRKVLASRRKQLTQLGMGNKPSATKALEDIEVEKLYECSFFGLTSPLILQRTMGGKSQIYFGHRARDEARTLKFGDIKLCKDLSGRKYLQWDKERGSKTRTGEKSYSHQRNFNPRAYETKTERCPIKIYECFVSHRPKERKLSDSPFFLTNIPVERIANNNVWYYNRPLGKNILGQFLSETSSILQNQSNCSRSKVSNHSARKTSISTLLNDNIHPIHVAQLSGHKNLESLNSYKHCFQQTARTYVRLDEFE